ncbi:hypothetical protein, partial [Escherichia coli]|uniref:hypothetical protein n=1 Tax=Escherichia coli TaxID=562 RepID=UPI003D36969E
GCLWCLWCLWVGWLWVGVGWFLSFGFGGLSWVVMCVVVVGGLCGFGGWGVWCVEVGDGSKSVLYGVTFPVSAMVICVRP